MAKEILSQLPRAIGLAGNELVLISQQGSFIVPWVSKTCTPQQIASFMQGGVVNPSMRQLVAAMASQGVLVGVAESVPGDITDPINIAWTHAYMMSISDIFVTGFLQPTLGYTDGQMTALFALAQTFPV